MLRQIRLFQIRTAERYGNGHPNIVPYNLFKSKNENFLIGNKKTFLLAKIDINESVIKIVKIISKILLEKYLNLNNINCILVIAEVLLKRS